MDDKLIDLVKISTKKNPADMMTKTIPVEKFRAFLNFIKFSKNKVANRLLRESQVKLQKGRENKTNEAEANFYRGTQ